MHGPVPRLISRLQWGLNPPTADLPPPKFLFQFRNAALHSIRLAGLARKLFRNCTFQFGGVRSVEEELSCRLPGATRCYGAPPKYGLNQSMAPFFGTLWYTRALYGATSQKHSICKSNQICLLLPIWHSSQCPSHIFIKCDYFRYFHKNVERSSGKCDSIAKKS